jgi:hypothetical protein
MVEITQPLGADEDLTLSRAWEKYRLSSEFDDKSPNTRKTEECRIKPVVAGLGG